MKINLFNGPTKFSSWLIFNLIISPLTEHDTFFDVHNAAQRHFHEQAFHRVAHWPYLSQLGKNKQSIDKNIF